MSCSSDSENYYSCSSNDSDDSYASVGSARPSLADTLKVQFSDVPRNFNVVHINAQSIPGHFPDMLTNFDNNNIHAILVSESWLKPCLPSNSYSLPGFTLIRNDRTPKTCGGVAIYLRSYIPYSVVDISSQPPSPNAGEHLFLEVELHHSKILLGVYYSPSLLVNYFSTFENLLHSLTPSYNHTIIMGDFNTCLLKKNSRSSSLLSIVKSTNLFILPLNATHFFPHCEPSLLDLILVSSLNHVAKHGQYPADVFSYHHLLYLSYKIRPPKAKLRILMQRNFGAMNIDLLRQDAKEIDWLPLLMSESTDEKVNILNNNLIALYDIHAPIRPIKVKHLPAPWLTDDIKKLIAKKGAAKSKYKMRPSDRNKENYLRIRNHCNKVCRNAQRQHVHSSVQNGDPAKVWKFLRTLGVGKQRQELTSTRLDINALNRHFSTSSNFSSTAKINTLNHLSSLPTPDYSPFVFSQLSVCDVEKSILSISSNAIGADSISRNMVLPILADILPIITHIMNHSISRSIFPTTWKDAQVIPLPKNSKPAFFTDYRPISILPFLSKVLERLIQNQLSSFIRENNLLNQFQSGFRPGHSTTTALVSITDDIRSGMEKGNLTILCLLDFSNAFNTVDFDVLLAILSSLNISPSAIDWFRSYLSGRRQRVRLDDSYSSWSDTAAGVPQGGVLSPLLFSIFINSISNRLLCSYHLYADDLQIYCQVGLDDLSNGIAMINADLVRLSDWTANYGLSINPGKTQVTVIGSSRLLDRVDWLVLPQVYFDGSIIPICDTVRNLGIYLDKTMSWSAQVQNISRKVFATGASLRRLRNFLPTATKIALAQSILLPILDYADVSYLDLNEDQLDKLERLQNFCIRFIFGLRKFDHISEFRIKLKWLPIRLRRNTHILSLLFNILFHPAAPLYLKNRFKFMHDTHTRYLRSSENLTLEIQQHATTFYDKSFTIQAARLWNALPESIRRAQSLPTFQKLVKEHYLTL